MFEKTFEAQALDAPSAHLSPFSIAIGVHIAAAVGILAISFVMVPVVQVPDPPEKVTFIWTVPLEMIPKRGSESPGPAVVPPQRVEPRDTPPTTTPDNLPPPAVEENDTPGEGEGAQGVPDGAPDGVPDGTGTGPAGPGGGGVGPQSPIELTPEMVRPVLLHKVSPTYPDVPRKARLEGRVTVQAVIGLDGSVESVEILRTTNPLFDAAALSAVRQWRYRPATMNGVPVRVYFTVEVGFVLR
jgi:protein TonB